MYEISRERDDMCNEFIFVVKKIVMLITVDSESNF